ncbi:MAG: hypothetical protein JWO87_3069 [Phycisphaerales bacterium]|jgi:hypothetical protein|nr:hypothetical protein [Phycisphaerales bacterium]
MSKGRNPRHPRTGKDPANPPRGEGQPRPGSSDKSGQEGREPTFPPPLKPRRTLFWILAVLVVAWLITLLVIYFITIYPNRAKLRTIEIDRTPQSRASYAPPGLCAKHCSFPMACAVG